MTFYIILSPRIKKNPAPFIDPYESSPAGQRSADSWDKQPAINPSNYSYRKPNT